MTRFSAVDAKKCFASPQLLTELQLLFQDPEHNLPLPDVEHILCFVGSFTKSLLSIVTLPIATGLSALFLQLE